MNITDTHIHLYAREFDNDREDLIEQAQKTGINRFFMPNIESTSIASMMELQQKYPGFCFAMMGLHPCSVKENFKEELKTVEEWLNKVQFKAIGEIGIDLYWDKTFIKEQEFALKKQIEWAHQYQLPIVIHSRNSFDEVYKNLIDMKSMEPRGIFHCFSGTIEQAKKIIDLGFYLGIGGVVTYKNSGLDKVVAAIDLKHLVLETDAPYLAPTPFRGKRNQPDYILNVAEKIAEIKETTVEDVALITTQNAMKIFDFEIS
jgi:TatD DNase family protein